jgi:HEAT repeat protein
LKERQLRSTLEEISIQLGAPDEEARRLAVVALAEHPFDQAMRLLFLAMGDESWRVRKEAVAVLLAAQPIGAQGVEGVIEMLRSADNAGLRNSAVESLERLGTSAVDPLCGHLGDPDHDLRKFVIDILGSIGCNSCVPLLVAALDDPDPNVRVAAAENLGKIGDPRALPHLLKVLEGGDLWLKFTVLDALALIGAPVPLDVLEPLLRESLLKRAIYDCLGAVGDAECLPLLLIGVQEQVKNAREAAAVALVRLRARLAPDVAAQLVDRPLKALKGSVDAEGLFTSLHGTDQGVLDALVQIVGIIGDARAVPGLLGVSRLERLRGSCLQAFRGVGAAALPQLLSRFPSAPGSERAFMALLFGELGLAQGVSLLLEGLTDDTPELRAACAQALGKLAPVGVSRHIERLLDDPYAEVREAALEALRRLGAQEPAELARLCAELAQSARPERRRDAALLLPNLADGERLSLLAKDEDASVRTAAVASLARVDLPQALGHLVMALADEEPQVRIAAALALGELGGSEVLEPLLLALNDSDPWVQTAALKGLAALGDAAALPGVTALLAEANGPVLIAGLSALAAVGGAGSLAPVRAALADGDEEVVQAAIGILAGTGSDWIPEYREALIGHPHWGVRRSFVRAMAQLLGAQALPYLKEALAKESDPLVKGEIAGLLGRYS